MLFKPSSQAPVGIFGGSACSPDVPSGDSNFCYNRHCPNMFSSAFVRCIVKRQFVLYTQVYVLICIYVNMLIYVNVLMCIVKRQ
jgi:hypothetical protein